MKIVKKTKLKQRGREKKCKNCGNNKGLISKYNLNLCRRCFKENAEKIGFSKFY